MRSIHRIVKTPPVVDDLTKMRFTVNSDGEDSLTILAIPIVGETLTITIDPGEGEPFVVTWDEENSGYLATVIYTTVGYKNVTVDFAGGDSKVGVFLIIRSNMTYEMGLQYGKYLKKFTSLTQFLAEGSGKTLLLTTDLPSSLSNIDIQTGYTVVGSLQSLPPNLQSFRCYDGSHLTGSIADLPVYLAYFYIMGTYPAPQILGGAFPYQIANIELPNGISTVEMSKMLQEMYTNRDNYVNTPEFTIYQNLSGVYQDATPPTTDLEYVYKLKLDPDLEGFNKWTIYGPNIPV